MADTNTFNVMTEESGQELARQVQDKLKNIGAGTPGKDGQSPTIRMGSVTTGEAGSQASASLTGTYPDYELNLTIPKGDQGPQGNPGADGAPGKDGSNGTNGTNGTNGADGAPGKDGEKGADGISCTHSWNGSTLTVTSASGTSSADLKGEKGDPGAKGDTGDKGEQGPKGDKGDKGDPGVNATTTEPVSSSANGLMTPSMLQSLNLLISWYSSFNASDGQTYGIRNRAPELICGSDEVVLVDDASTAVSLSLQALNSGRIPAEAIGDEAMLSEMRSLIGEELFEEILSASVATQEEAAVMSDLERIEKAKQNFLTRKARMAEMAEAEELETGSLDVERGSMDVEPDKTI